MNMCFNQSSYGRLIDFYYIKYEISYIRSLGYWWMLQLDCNFIILRVYFDICCCYAQIQATPDLYVVTYLFVITEMWQSISHFEAWNGEKSASLHSHTFTDFFIFMLHVKLQKIRDILGRLQVCDAYRPFINGYSPSFLLFKYLLCACRNFLARILCFSWLLR